ncbi:MAG: Lrp/AsnC family transcriptional regulator [Candidatus Micrarchaeota archaeon]
MDAIDEKIMALLEKDSRTPNIVIAGKLKISEGTVRNRIQRLVDEGAIARFTIDRGSFGFSALALIRTDAGTPTGKIVKKLLAIDGVKTVREVTGDWDVVCRIQVSNAEQFNDIIEKIRLVPKVLETKSLVVLKSH